MDPNTGRDILRTSTDRETKRQNPITLRRLTTMTVRRSAEEVNSNRTRRRGSVDHDRSASRETTPPTGVAILRILAKIMHRLPV